LLLLYAGNDTFGTFLSAPGGQKVGRPKALDNSKAELAQRMHASGESASTIAAALGVSRATVYRVLATSVEE
jgi:DNA invertase Pin-like site-specific DNA recombinase